MNPLQLIRETARKAGKPVEELGKVERDYAITRLASSNRGKLFLFELEGTEFTGYTNLVTARKDVYALFEATTDLEVYSRVIKALENPAPLDTVEFDDYFERRDYTLDSLPFVKYYRDDGSRYLTSSIYIICYERTCNASYHRTMYKSPAEAPIRVVPRQLHFLMKKYHDRGVDAPVAMVLGADPYFELAAAMTPPLGVFEASVAAAMSGYNKVVKTPLYKIPV
ncbi:MAG: UbiD family decarboxylase domain-containing protein, partial [Thermosphaera sp.]